ncbi:hypothetical protein GQR58_010466 [Nymphon striatum]|nr:hypothetical protein GQR58_010466 [Nymphon striatum]
MLFILVNGVGGKLISDVKQKAVTTQNGADKPSTVMQTDVDIPQQNIYESFKQTSFDNHVLKKKKSNQMGNPRQRIEFNPLELAKYIDDTGDEEGIVLAINELMEDGMLTREQALEYLQRIRLALEMMRTSEEQHGNALNEIRLPNVRIQVVYVNFKDNVAINYNAKFLNLKKAEQVNEEYPGRSSEYAPTEEEQELKQEGGKVFQSLHVREIKHELWDKVHRYGKQEGGKAFKRVHIPGMKYELWAKVREYGKVTWKGNVFSGDVKDVQRAVERLATLVENEKQFGKISDELESEILETMTSAMVASLAENKRGALSRFNMKEEMENELTMHAGRPMNCE